MNKIQYDTNILNFKELVKNVFDVKDLENIHLSYQYEGGLCTNQDNSNSIYHKRFYSKLREGWPEFIELYENLIIQKIKPLFTEEFIYQTTPTLRIHLVKNWATPEFHCDSQEGYNHPEGEINFLLPLTDCYGTNTVWSESEP